MANRRITELQVIAGTSLAEDDLFTVVHVGEVDPTLKNRSLTLSGTKQYLDIYYLPRTGGTVSGAVVLQGDLTVSGNTNFTAATFTGVVTVGSLLAQSGIIASGTISGATITGENVQGTNVNGVLGNFTTLTGQTINVTSGNFLQQISGVTITGNTVTATTGNYTSLTGVTTTGTTANFTSGNFIALSGTTLDLSGNYAQNITAVSALNIDLSTSNYFTKTINANSTFTVSNTPSSRAFSFTLELTHTSGTITWFSGVEWPGGTAPTLTTGKTHLFMFVTDDGGTRWRGASLTNYTT